MCLYNRVIGEKPVTHGTTPPFPLSAASRQAGYAARLCCVSSRSVLRFLSASSAGSNTKRFPPASVPAAGQRTDKFRHSPALGNTRLWCLADMFLIGFLFGHGNSPFLRLWERAAALFAVAPWLPTSKDRRGCQRWAAAHSLAVDWLGWVCYFWMVIADLILATISNGAYYEGNSKNQNCRYPCD